MILRIARIPPSPNELLGQPWRVKHRVNLVWRDEIGWAVKLGAHRPAAPYERAHVRIQRSSRGTLDTDNLWGSVKPVVDALRHAGVIENDTPDHIHLEVSQCRGPAYTRIEVTPL